MNQNEDTSSAIELELQLDYAERLILRILYSEDPFTAEEDARNWLRKKYPDDKTHDTKKWFACTVLPKLIVELEAEDDKFWPEEI